MFRLLTTENLRYLSVDQGIEDLAAFIRYFKSTRQELKDAKVTIIGGSYTGGFVSWFRSVYPELTVGAWSSSGVIDPQPSFSSNFYKHSVFHYKLLRERFLKVIESFLALNIE